MNEWNCASQALDSNGIKKLIFQLFIILDVQLSVAGCGKLETFAWFQNLLPISVSWRTGFCQRLCIAPTKCLMQNGNCMHTHTKRKQEMPQVRLCIFNAKTRTLPTKANTWYIYKSRLVKLASLVFMIISYFVEVFRQLNGFHVSFHSFVFILNFIIFSEILVVHFVCVLYRSRAKYNIASKEMFPQRNRKHIKWN